MLSNKPVKENDESNPCIEISDIKYEIFTVRREKVICNGHTPVDANLHPVHQNVWRKHCLFKFDE